MSKIFAQELVLHKNKIIYINRRVPAYWDTWAHTTSHSTTDQFSFRGQSISRRSGDVTLFIMLTENLNLKKMYFYIASRICRDWGLLPSNRAQLSWRRPTSGFGQSEIKKQRNSVPDITAWDWVSNCILDMRSWVSNCILDMKAGVSNRMYGLGGNS